MPEITYVSEISETEDILSRLSPPVRNWFKDKFPDFTEPQKVAIPQILSGEHLLLCSPTGSGKTLTAFLSIIDDLVRKSLEGKLTDTVQCIYISPIKALANDIQKNLIGPLTEIKERFLPGRAQEIKVGGYGLLSTGASESNSFEPRRNGCTFTGSHQCTSSSDFQHF